MTTKNHVKKKKELPHPLSLKKLFSRRTCLCPTLLLLKRRLKTLRRPQTIMLKPMTLSWLKLMWSLHQPKHQKSAKPLIPLLLLLCLLPVLSSTIMLSTGLRYRSQSQDCPGFQVLHQHLDPSMSMASKQTTLSSIAPRTPTQGKEYLLIGSGAIRSEAITPTFCTIKVASSHICVLTLKQ